MTDYIKEDEFKTVAHKKKLRKKTQRNKEVMCLVKEGGTLDQVSEDQGWEKITLKVDSGAIDTCIPPSVGKAFKLEESAMSKYNAEYRAANGTKIKNHGQRKISAMDESWSPFKLEAQVVDVSTALGSVFHMCNSGNIVAFDNQGGLVINKATGRRMPIKLRQGSYEVDMWVPRASSTGDPRNLASSEEEAISMDFIRQGQ